MKFFAFLVSLLFLADSFLALANDVRAATSGTCGENLTWTYYSGMLTINGTGNMTNYAQYGSPWNDFGSQITIVEIENGATSIGDFAFWGLRRLWTLSIPSSLTHIGSYSFVLCGFSSLTIPEGVQSIGSYAFSNCDSLTSVKLPSSVTSIEGAPFPFCDYLRTIEVSSSNSRYETQENALIDKINHILVQYPAGKNTATTYNIPSAVTSIGYCAFCGCTKLTSIDFPAWMASIGASAFDDCSGLKSVAIPSGISSIEEKTFSGCSSLTSIDFPSSVESIGFQAFYGCSSLTQVYIPPSVTSIGNSSFSGCNNLTSITYLGSSDPGVSTSNVFLNCRELNVICVPESYDSESFCGKDIICKSSSCVRRCSEVRKYGNECVSEEKPNATEWENHSDECVEYFCSEESGFSSKSICYKKNAHILCFKGECVDKDKVEGKGWMVDIEIECPVFIVISPEGVEEELYELTGVNKKDFEIGTEHDEEGRIIRVVVKVVSHSEAENIKSDIDSMDKSEPCNSIFCCSKGVTIKELTSPAENPSTASTFKKDAINCVMITMAAIMLLMLSTI